MCLRLPVSFCCGGRALGRVSRGAGWYLLGAMLMGWGIFNFVEGLVDHQILGIHHVREDVPRDQWLYWDLGFLLWGLLMLLGGWWMTRRNSRSADG